MTISVKRIYDSLEKDDSTRVLVDRLWPRGVKKEDADIYIWAKELAPSNDLRKWFHEDKEKRFSKFKEKYQKELESQKENIKETLPKRKSIMLVTSVKDIDHSHIPVLKEFLEKNL